MTGDKTGRGYIEKKKLSLITDQNEQSYAQVLGQGHKSHKKDRQTDKGRGLKTETKRIAFTVERCTTTQKTLYYGGWEGWVALTAERYLLKCLIIYVVALKQ